MPLVRYPPVLAIKGLGMIGVVTAMDPEVLGTDVLDGWDWGTGVPEKFANQPFSLIHLLWDLNHSGGENGRHSRVNIQFHQLGIFSQTFGHKSNLPTGIFIVEGFDIFEIPVVGEWVP